MEFSELPEFTRELKRLQKKYPSLTEDINRLKKLLAVKPRGTGGKHWNCLHKNGGVEVYKVRLACAYLNANTMRVIYGYHLQQSLEFIELYYKGEKDNEDRERIKLYLKSKS